MRSGIGTGPVVEAGVIAVVGNGEQRVRIAGGVLSHRVSRDDGSVRPRVLLPIQRPRRTGERRVGEVDVVADTVLSSEGAGVRVTAREGHHDVMVAVLDLDAILREVEIRVADRFVGLPVDRHAFRLHRVVVRRDLACVVVPLLIDPVERWNHVHAQVVLEADRVSVEDFGLDVVRRRVGAPGCSDGADRTDAFAEQDRRTAPVVHFLFVTAARRRSAGTLLERARLPLVDDVRAELRVRRKARVVR